MNGNTIIGPQSCIVEMSFREVVSKIQLRVTEYDRTRLRMKLGLLFIRFGCWVSGIGGDDGH